MTFQEKDNFVQRMQLLPPPSLKALIDTIKQLAPKAFVEHAEKPQIIIDYIDAATFPIVKEYSHSYYRQLEDLLVTHRVCTKKVKSA